jgi:hypothetical protein
MPKYSLNLFLDRCRGFGAKDKVLGFYLDRMRKVHKGEDTWGNREENGENGENGQI